MSRRKQSNPRQIRRSPGDMEVLEEAQAPDTSLQEKETPTPEPTAVGRPEPLSPSSRDVNPPPAPTVPTPAHLASRGPPEEMEGPEPEMQPLEETASPWSGPEELQLELRDGRSCVQARLSLDEGLSWGPFHGSIQARASTPGQAEQGPALTLLLTDKACWLRTLPQALTEADANSEIYRKDDGLWCRITRPVPAGGALCVRLTVEPRGTPSCPVKEEPNSPGQMHPDIQLLPQQAGMASILATAVINKDIFPCKDCGIWYRSERNLQAHLLYYCASRQGASSPATTATEDKPKEPYPNERICPFPQCRKSCPSASSLEIHMRSHSGVCHSCGFISTTRDILYSHLVTSHMVCQPGSKGEIYSSGAAHPAAKLPPDTLSSLQQHAALHGPLPSADLGLATTPSPALDRKALVEATNGEARAAPQNGSGGDSPTVPRSVKVEAEKEAEAVRTPGRAEPATRAPSRTPSPHSPGANCVKAELPSPTPGASPAPGELALASTLFLPQLVFAPDAGATPGPAAPQASEILAKMSELVHSRLQQGTGPPAALLAGTKGATCFECEITFNNVNNYYVHKRLYCSGRRAPEDAPATRKPKAPPGAPAEPDAPRSPPGPGAGEDETGGAVTPEAEGPGRSSEGSQSPGSSVDDAEDDPSRTLCEACNIRFSRHETYTVHKRYYCASRHDPPPRRPPVTAPAPGSAAPALTTPPARTRRRRKLYELHAPGSAPAPPSHAPVAEPPASPGPGSASANAGPAPARSPAPPAADGPIDLSKRPRRQTPDRSAPLPALADYHECTACRVSFHSLEAYLAHKQYACPAAPLRPAAVCPYCPANGRARGDLVEHLRRAHGLRGPAPRAPAEHAPRDSPPPRSPSPPPQSSEAPADPGAPAPGKGPPAAPAPGSHRYCRLCNIRFSSLSTFIAHKKYYCSSHAAEHVK
ncbi:zinc finger protein ZFPM1 isoform X2 [Octodon degus]|uniref:Zinc finger protein ZFPM1 isoform X2 n=1 Tax=Octodon degus TaxID=10160 RepID=A0A6P6DLM4_OCTDE|nr:zinc finger protein ZFPM1 isoform X2 [Octodon degus]